MHKRGKMDSGGGPRRGRAEIEMEDEGWVGNRGPLCPALRLATGGGREPGPQTKSEMLRGGRRPRKEMKGMLQGSLVPPTSVPSPLPFTFLSTPLSTTGLPLLDTLRRQTSVLHISTHPPQDTSTRRSSPWGHCPDAPRQLHGHSDTYGSIHRHPETLTVMVTVRHTHDRDSYPTPEPHRCTITQGPCQTCGPGHTQPHITTQAHSHVPTPDTECSLSSAHVSLHSVTPSRTYMCLPPCLTH